MKQRKSSVKTPSTTDNHRGELYRALLELEDEEECRRFLSDLCTPDELNSMAERWLVAQLVFDQVPYRRISEQTSVSTATITRVARALSYGEGGYGKVIVRLRKKQKKA